MDMNQPEAMVRLYEDATKYAMQTQQTSPAAT